MSEKEGGFQACRITDTDDENAASFDEAHICGGRMRRWEGGFTLLADGQEGLRHAVPLDIPASVLREILVTGHYVAFTALSGYETTAAPGSA